MAPDLALGGRRRRCLRPFGGTGLRDRPGKLDERPNRAMLCAQLPQTERRTACAEDAADSTEDGHESEDRSGVTSTTAWELDQAQASASNSQESRLPDEAERTRLIADLTRLIRVPCVPELTRLAGLTLIGWLARRRSDETPHALGIEEARQSESRTRSARIKSR